MKIREMLEEIIKEQIDAFDVEECVEEWLEDNQVYIQDEVTDKLTPVFKEAITEHLAYVIDNILDELIDSPKIFGYALEAVERKVND